MTGVAGSAPQARPFGFFALDPSEWPNVISIEPCLNCQDAGHGPCSYWIDNMKYFINHHYKEKGLEEPYYFFLEFFRSSNAYFSSPFDSRSDDLVALPLNTSKLLDLSDPKDNEMYPGGMRSRGAPYAPFMMEFARFYGMPVLSVTDVLYPSWVRFHLTHADNELWPYSHDGVHTSESACKSVVSDRILMPFFLEQMAPRESDKLYEKKRNLQFSPYPADLRMFPSDQYKEIHVLSKSSYIYIYILVHIFYS